MGAHHGGIEHLHQMRGLAHRRQGIEEPRQSWTDEDAMSTLVLDGEIGDAAPRVETIRRRGGIKRL